MAGAEHARHDLAEAPEAGDDDMMISARRYLVFGRLRLQSAVDGVVDEEKQRRRRHRQRHGERQEIGHWPVDDALERARPEQHEGELAALTEYKTEASCRAPVEPPPAAEQIKNDGLEDHEAQDNGEELHG